MLNGRYNIALLAANITDPFSNALAVGAMKAARELDADLTIIPGKYVSKRDKYDLYDITYEYQYNILFDYAARANFDYVIAAVGTIAYALGKDGKKEFLDSLGDTPVLSVAADIDGYDSLEFDNSAGIRAVVDELAAQGRRRIGIMAGDLNNTECAERYAAFRDSLKRYGIDFPEKYFVTCDLSEYCRDEADRLLDAAPELDAVVCANDIIASTLYKAIKARGKTVGRDIAVTGFDDIPLASELSPPLATVRADAEQLGRRAVQKVLNKLRGIPDEDRLFPTEFIKRGSCTREEPPGKIYKKLEDNERSEMIRYFRERKHIDNVFVRDTLIIGGEKNSYTRIMQRLSFIGSPTSFLYTLKEPLVHHPGDVPPDGLEWDFRAYCYGEAAYAPDDELRRLTTPQVFCNEKLCSDRQHCFVVSDLYVADTQYGIALLEPQNEDFFSELELITYILSSAVRALNIMRSQERLLGRLKTANLALEEQSKLDPLTGIFNRRGFYGAADSLFESGSAEYVICYADMDNLKLVNDEYGHIEGDFSLALVAKCLREVFGEEAIIGRMGGDEFAVILPAGGTDTATYHSRGKKFIEEFNASGQKPYRFGVSMGILRLVCENGYDLKAALDKADDLLYDEKQKRKKEI